MTSRLPIWAALFALIPFTFTGEIYEGGLLPRLLLLQVGLLAVSVWLAVSAHRQHLPVNLLLLAALWPAAAALSILQAANTTESFAQLSHYAAFATIPLLIVSSLSARVLLRLFRIVTLAALPVSLLGISQYLGVPILDVPSQAQPSATFFHRNAAAGYLTAAIPLAVAAWWTESRNPWKRLYGVSAALALAYLVFTRTRGAWLGMAVATIAVWLLSRINPSAPRDSRSLRLPLAVAAAVIVIAAVIPDRIQSERPAFDDKKDSAIGAVASIATGGHRGRPELWANTLSMIADHAMFGVGVGNWEFVYPDYARGEQVNITAAPRRPHNDLLWIASETGLIGLAAYLALLIATLRLGIRGLSSASGENRVLLLAAMFVVVAHLVDGQFNFPRERVGGASLFWASVAVPWLLTRDERRVDPGRLFYVGLACLLLWSAQLTTRRIGYDYHHLRVHAAERAGDWPTVLEQAPRAFAYGSFRANTWIALGRAHYRAGDVDAAIAAYRNALDLHPNSLNAYNNLGTAYRKAGRPEEAILALKRAIELYPAFVEAHNNLGNALRDLGEIEASIRAFETALAKNPNIAQIHVNLGRSYEAIGDVQRARFSYLNALKLDPNHQGARRALTRLMPPPEEPSVDRS